ncbi:hypothetical protein ACI6PS_12995 [Flavobacterium sp. PLA-1-15]|uniref:hypothetical protein n=1 Tax=Flavobacterium sp. PLA-1-15 TaxID=3380533 RepID=UPI003B7A1441
MKKALHKYYKELSIQKLHVDPNSQVVVSLTSFPARINTVHLTIKSIMNQTCKPQRVVLWLAEEQFPDQEQGLPKQLLELKEKGLEIEFCEDLRPHKKYFYTFRKFPNNSIVTIDDDIFYPIDTLEKLFALNQKEPNCIIANRVREIGFEERSLTAYRDWKINQVYNSEPSKRLFPTGVGGILYKPSFFDDGLFNVENIKKICLNADDVWLKANSLKNNIPVVFTNYYFYPFIEIPNSQESSLYSINVFAKDNDKQIQEVFDFFGITINHFKR